MNQKNVSSNEETGYTSTYNFGFYSPHVNHISKLKHEARNITIISILFVYGNMIMLKKKRKRKRATVRDRCGRVQSVDVDRKRITRSDIRSARLSPKTLLTGNTCWSLRNNLIIVQQSRTHALAARTPCQPSELDTETGPARSHNIQMGYGLHGTARLYNVYLAIM